MLTIIADQTAFALTNAQLFDTEQHRRKVADTLASIAHTVNATLDLKEVLDLILEQLSLVVEYDSSSILLYEPNNSVLAVKRHADFQDMADALQVRIPYNEEQPKFPGPFT
jgi:GAF domain-containing protein